MRTANDDHRDADRVPSSADEWRRLRDVLADQHGKYAVKYLASVEGSVDLDELARGVVGLLDGTASEDVDDEVARHVRTWLHHGHLPVLDEHGVVDYDPETGTVLLPEPDAVDYDPDADVVRIVG